MWDCFRMKYGVCGMGKLQFFSKEWRENATFFKGIGEKWFSLKEFGKQCNFQGNLTNNVFILEWEFVKQRKSDRALVKSDWVQNT